MSIKIEIWNPNKGIEIVTLRELRDRINQRRKLRLKGTGLIKSAQREITVFTTDKTSEQPACHYTSFAIAEFTHEKAVNVYNAGGSQIAKVIC